MPCHYGRSCFRIRFDFFPGARSFNLDEARSRSLEFSVKVTNKCHFIVTFSWHGDWTKVSRLLGNELRYYCSSFEFVDIFVKIILGPYLTWSIVIGLHDVSGFSVVSSSYEGWNFNSGNYLFTTDTK